MDYVINPMWFYWLGVVDNLNIFFWSMIITLLFIGIVLNTIRAVEYENLSYTEVEEGKNVVVVKKMFKQWLIVFFCILPFVLLIVFTPSKETMIKMTVSKQVTYKNIDKAEEKIKETFDYIVDKVKEIKEGE
jgi:hypothetical protein